MKSFSVKRVLVTLLSILILFVVLRLTYKMTDDKLTDQAKNYFSYPENQNELVKLTEEFLSSVPYDSEHPLLSSDMKICTDAGSKAEYQKAITAWEALLKDHIQTIEKFDQFAENGVFVYSAKDLQSALGGINKSRLLMRMYEKQICYFESKGRQAEALIMLRKLGVVSFKSVLVENSLLAVLIYLGEGNDQLEKLIKRTQDATYLKPIIDLAKQIEFESTYQKAVRIDAIAFMGSVEAAYIDDVGSIHNQVLSKVMHLNSAKNEISTVIPKKTQDALIDKTEKSWNLPQQAMRNLLTMLYSRLTDSQERLKHKVNQLQEILNKE